MAIIFMLGTFVLWLVRYELLDIFEWMRANKPESVIIYIGFFVVWTLMMMPKTFPQTAAGFIFGFKLGITVSVIAGYAVVFACIAIVRFAVPACSSDDDGQQAGADGPDSSKSSLNWRERTKRYILKEYPEIAVLNSEMDPSRSFAKRTRIVFLLVLVPAPAFVKNYGLAVLDTPSDSWLFAYFFSGLFYATAASWIGSSAKNLTEVLNGTSSGEGNESNGMIQLVVLVVGLLVTAIVLAYTKRLVDERVEKLRCRQLERGQSASALQAGPEASDAVPTARAVQI